MRIMINKVKIKYAMIRIGLGTLLLLLTFALYAQKGELSKSDMVKLDFTILAANKVKVKANDAAVMPAYN